MRHNIQDPSLLGKKDIIKRLTNNKREKRILVNPILSSSQIQPASMDVRLGSEFLVIKIGKITHLEPLRNNVKEEVDKYTDRYKILNKHDRFILHPNEFVLGSTLEYIHLPKDIAARIEGRSSWGRLGVSVHSTAGFVDPGFCGNITFELKNGGKVPIPLYPGIRIAQLAFYKLKGKSKYKGKYNESFGTVSSQYFKDYEYKNMRDAYNRGYYEELIIKIFESVDNEKGLPQTNSPERFPKELIDAIAAVYEEHSNKYQQNDLET